MAVFRGNGVGADQSGYYDDFVKVDSTNYAAMALTHNFEIGFVLLIYYFKTYILNSYVLFSALMFSIFYLGVIRIITFCKVFNGIMILAFYCLGVYFYAYNIMRQMMVIGIMFMLYPILYKTNINLLIRYFVYILASLFNAALFHTSAIVFILIIPIHYIFFYKRFVIPKILLSLFLLSSFLLGVIDNKFFINWVWHIAKFIGNYTGYAQVKDSASGIGYMAIITIYALIAIFYKKQKKRNVEFYIFIFGVILYNIGNTMNDAAYRLALPLYSFVLIAIPQLAKYLEFDRKVSFYFITIIFCISSFIWQYMIHNSGVVNPYYFFIMDNIV